ncbi:MAG: mercury transporter MerT [Alphaproteobacteria bacterium]|nr:MAG: mercury transporter MerT [Alphaproteobacteria bacterium]
MASIQDNARSLEGQGADLQSKSRCGGLLAGASVLGAIIASSCCVVPLLFVMLGIGGAWMSNLTALEPYKPYSIGVTAVLLGLGYWHVYFKPKKACEAGSYCANPTSGRITKAALWIATVIVLLAATVNVWAPLFY